MYATGWMSAPNMDSCDCHDVHGVSGHTTPRAACGRPQSPRLTHDEARLGGSTSSTTFGTIDGCAADDADAPVRLAAMATLNAMAPLLELAVGFAAGAAAVAVAAAGAAAAEAMLAKVTKPGTAPI